MDDSTIANWLEIGIIIISVISIIAPILTTLIDNIFKIKMKNIDNYELEKCKALNNFIDTTIECITTIGYNGKLEHNSPDKDILKSFYKTSSNLLLYFPKVNSKELEKLNDSVRSGQKEKIIANLDDIVKELSKYIKKK